MGDLRGRCSVSIFLVFCSSVSSFVLTIDDMYITGRWSIVSCFLTISKAPKLQQFPSKLHCSSNMKGYLALFEFPSLRQTSQQKRNQNKNKKQHQIPMVKQNNNGKVVPTQTFFVFTPLPGEDEAILTFAYFCRWVSWWNTTNYSHIVFHRCRWWYRMLPFCTRGDPTTWWWSGWLVLSKGGTWQELEGFEGFAPPTERCCETQHVEQKIRNLFQVRTD